MGKVRYKEPTGNFDKLLSKVDNNNLRASIGNDRSIGEFYFISTEYLIPYEKQARKIFNEDEIYELSCTIKEHGIQCPLLIVPSKSVNGKFEVVSGERRLRAANLINLEKVPCIIVDDNTAEEVALIENIQRSELHPVEIGDAISSLLSKSGWGEVSKLADKLGKDQTTISHYLSYSRLPKNIKDNIVKNNYRSRDFLRKLLKCSSESEMESLISSRSKNNEIDKKSVLRVSIQLGEVSIQDKSLYSLSKSKLDLVKQSLLDIIRKIDVITS